MDLMHFITMGSLILSVAIMALALSKSWDTPVDFIILLLTFYSLLAMAKFGNYQGAMVFASVALFLISIKNYFS